MFDLNQLRKAFGSYLTGVTVVTTKTEQGVPLGFTANSFSSVSLDPPLVLVCPAKSLSCFEVFETCEHFAVNVLADHQQGISVTFASSRDDRFSQLDWFEDLHGSPLIRGCSAQFSCSTQNLIDAGDHAILLGQVESFEVSENPGLGYAQTGYFSLGLERRAAELNYQENLVRVGAIIEHDNKILLEKRGEQWQIPGVAARSRNDSLSELRDLLAGQGVDIKIGSVYSIFQDRQSHEYHSFYRASAQNDSVHEHAEWVEMSKVGELNYRSHAIKEMMKRYALERSQGVFRLYVGDEKEGDVHEVGVER